MYSVLKGITWTLFVYWYVLVAVWAVSATTAAAYYRLVLEYKFWFLAFVPGMGTALNAYSCTGNVLYSVIGMIWMALCWVTWNPVLCICYVALVIIVNCMFLMLCISGAIAPLGCIGIYKIILQWKEIIECLNCNKAKSTKKTKGTTRKKPRTTRKPQNLR